MRGKHELFLGQDHCDVQEETWICPEMRCAGKRVDVEATVVSGTSAAREKADGSSNEFHKQIIFVGYGV